MQRILRTLLSLMALVALTGLVACGGDDAKVSESTDVNTLLKETFTGKKDVKSGKFDLSVKLDVKGGNAPVQGPINVKLPKVLKVPEGEIYSATENPLGFNGYYLVSRGEKTPWRLKLRTASFNNVAVLPEIVGGCVVADLVAVLGSMFFVVGDIDK